MSNPTILVGQYRLDECIASSRLNVVYEATELATGRSVIVKTPRPLSMLGPAARPSPSCEGATLRLLRRRGLPAPRFVTEFWDGGRPYLVMSRIQGETLERLADQRQLSPGEIVQIVRQLGLGVQQLHQTGYAHNDIKPSNIIVQPDGIPVLIDWESAEPIAGESDLRPDVTLTPPFASPERLRGESGPGNDIYALGCTLDYLIEWPSPRLTMIIDRAIAPIDRRYSSAADLSRDLSRLSRLDRLAQIFGFAAI